MIPIHDNIPSRTYPIVNVLLIWANFVGFAVEVAQGAGMRAFIERWGMTPDQLANGPLASGAAVTLLTHMFLHGGWLHIIGNMWFLYLFGDNVEDRLGHFRYLAFYLVCGFASAGTHLLFNAASTIPVVGASGAIAGVLGAYLVLFPFARVAALVWMFLLVYVVEIPAAIFLGLWFLFQFASGVALSASPQQGGVAWWAHVGGFVAGVALVKLFCSARGHCKYPYDVLPSR